jgi:hypothetical protein
MSLELPTSQIIERGIADFNADEGAKADKAIEQLIRAFPHNSRLEHVLLKVAVISRLYNAPLYAAPIRVAQHIYELDLDTHLEMASAEIVNTIAAVPSVPRRLYSFATKYCGWHRPEEYPLYDSYVRRALIAYRDNITFVTSMSVPSRITPSTRALCRHFGLRTNLRAIHLRSSISSSGSSEKLSLD